MANSEQVQAASSSKKIIISGAVILVVFATSFVAFWFTRGGEFEARIMEIFSVDGPDVNLTKGAEATVAASVGARLHDDYGMEKVSYFYI